MSNKATKITIILIILAILVVILGTRFFSGEDSWDCVDGQWVKHGFPYGDKPDRECRNKASDDVAKSKPEEKKIETENGNSKEANNSSEKNIVVSSPLSGEKIGLPVTIKGEARVFENTVNYRIKDSHGKIILERYTNADSKDIGQFGPFEETTNYPDPEDEEGIIEVFEYSAKDGSEINKVEIPVTFKKIEAMDIKVYFGNRKENSDDENCNQVYEIGRRIAKTQSVARAALLELISGTTLKDEDDGFFSEISKETKINSLSIVKGIVKVDFNRELLEGIDGSCEKETIKGQITETLKQFLTVKEVKITVDGEENVL